MAFFEAHPGVKAFVETPKPIPTSYARQAYFAITAFKFINAAGESRSADPTSGPAEGTEFLTPEQAQKKTSDFLAAEMSARLGNGASNIPPAGPAGGARRQRYRLNLRLA